MSKNLLFSIICILFGGAEWKNFTDQFERIYNFNIYDDVWKIFFCVPFKRAMLFV